MSAREPEPAPHYMVVTADNLETPVAVFDDLDAMCRWARISKHVAYCMLSRGTVRKKGPAAGCRLVPPGKPIPATQKALRQIDRRRQQNRPENRAAFLFYR